MILNETTICLNSLHDEPMSKDNTCDEETIEHDDEPIPLFHHNVTVVFRTNNSIPGLPRLQLPPNASKTFAVEFGVVGQTAGFTHSSKVASDVYAVGTIESNRTENGPDTKLRFDPASAGIEYAYPVDEKAEPVRMRGIFKARRLPPLGGEAMSFQN